MIERERGVRRDFFSLLTLAALSIFLVTASACAGRKDGPFNLLVITLDTTRADGIGAYGNPDAATPHIDRLAAGGIMFRNCYTAVPLTLPSHCTLFTGRYPPAHRVRNNGTYYLPADETTLAEILKARGFRTFACIASFTLLSKFGIGQGFEAFDETFQQKQATLNYHDEIPADEITRKFTSWLENSRGGRFFSWLHFFDPHSPYQVHPEVDGRFAGSERLKYEGEIAYVDLHIGKIIRLLESKKLLERTILVIVGDHGEAFGEHGEFGHGIFCYEESLKVPLILYNPILFAKNRRIDSRVSLADVLPSLLHYLAIACPEGVQGKSFHNLVAGEREKRQRDIYFESRFGLEANNWAPITGLIADGHKYISLVEPELYDLGRDPGERANLYRQKNILARDLDQKLRRFIIDRAPAGKAGRRELSVNDLASLKTLGYITSGSAKSKDMIDPKRGLGLYMEVEALKLKAAAGDFLGAQAGLEQVMARNPGALLPNFFELEFTIRKNTGRMPEALAALEKAIAAFPDQDSFKIILATELVSRNGHARAQELCREILARNPRFAAAWILLGDISRKQNDRQQAIAHYRQALASEPQNTRLRDILSELSLPASAGLSAAPASTAGRAGGPDSERLAGLEKRAAALLADNRLTEARAVLEDILRIDPRRVDALVNMGTVAYRSGEFAPALRYFQEAARLNPRHALALSNMGIVCFSLFQKEGDRSQLPLALGHFNTALQLDPRLGDAYNGRGAVYLALNEGAKAVSDFKKVIELKPGDVDAHFNVAYALVSSGQKSEALDILIRFKKSYYMKLSPQDRSELDALIAEVTS